MSIGKSKSGKPPGVDFRCPRTSNARILPSLTTYVNALEPALCTRALRAVPRECTDEGFAPRRTAARRPVTGRWCKIFATPRPWIAGSLAVALTLSATRLAGAYPGEAGTTLPTPTAQPPHAMSPPNRAARSRMTPPAKNSLARVQGTLRKCPALPPERALSPPRALEQGPREVSETVRNRTLALVYQGPRSSRRKCGAHLAASVYRRQLDAQGP